MAKAIQIAVSLTRDGGEQHGKMVLVALLDDGRIFERRESEGDLWQEAVLPWDKQ